MLLLRSLFAVLLGYAVMVAGTWFAQETMFPTVEFGVSGVAQQLALGFFVTAAGGMGGAVTAMLAPRRPFLHLLPMAILISVETIVLYAQERVHGPLWYELLAGAVLISGTFLGAWLWLAVSARLARGKRAHAARQ